MGARPKYDYTTIAAIINYHLNKPEVSQYIIAEHFKVSQYFVNVTINNHFQCVEAGKRMKE